MTNLPPLNDHAFFREVRRHCEDMSRSMSEIAADLGVDVDDLCRWIMAYKAPKAHKTVDNSKYGPAIAPPPPIATGINRAKDFAEYRRAAYAGAPRAGARL